MNAYAGRRFRNNLMMGLSILASVVGLFFLLAILITLLYKGFAAITPQMFTASTPPPGQDGGLINAIFGSVVMTVAAVVVATPIGILAGTYLAEYSRGHWLGEVAKFINDILLSAPSIIIGLFVYTILVVPFGHFSAWSGAAALGLIALPVINRTTQDMLGLVPNALREAAAALGTPRWKTMLTVIYRAARSGILTGVLLAIARVTGETAPLLFTALGSRLVNVGDFKKPMDALPLFIYNNARQPFPALNQQAWASALLLLIVVLAINVLVRARTWGSRAA